MRAFKGCRFIFASQVGTEQVLPHTKFAQRNMPILKNSLYVYADVLATVSIAQSLIRGLHANRHTDTRARLGQKSMFSPPIGVRNPHPSSDAHCPRKFHRGQLYTFDRGQMSKAERTSRSPPPPPPNPRHLTHTLTFLLNY